MVLHVMEQLIEKYNTMLKDVKTRTLTGKEYQEWTELCTTLLHIIIEKDKEILMRLKDR